MRIYRRLRVRLRKHDREFLDTMLRSGSQYAWSFAGWSFANFMMAKPLQPLQPRCR